MQYSGFSNREHANQARLELAWYKLNGKYADRITKDATGQEYVIGDWSWNRLHPDRVEHFEHRILDTARDDQ